MFASSGEWNAETSLLFAWYWAAKFGNLCTYWYQIFLEKIRALVTSLSSNDSTHSRDAIHVKRILFFLLLKDFWCQTWESLNVKVIPHNSCNHGSLWLQSLELKAEWRCTWCQIPLADARTRIQLWRDQVSPMTDDTITCISAKRIQFWRYRT